MKLHLWPKQWNKSINKRKAFIQLSSVEKFEERLVLSAVFAPIDGVGNNEINTEWGSSDTQLLRIGTVEYGDGISSPAGEDRPSAREISNVVVAQDESIKNSQHLSDLAWVWGQFLDHEIDLTETGYPVEEWNIEVPTGDLFFDPYGTGTEVIGFNRSIYDPDTGDAVDNPRQQLNQITAYIDGSVVYGSEETRAAELRSFSGGLLKTSEGNLLPFNEAGLENAGSTSSSLFLAGDVRANENVALSSMHTVFVREHNRIATEIAQENPELSDEEIYQQARRLVTAEIQAITYNEFLPALLGEGAIGLYQGYDASVNPGISNLFSTAAYRLGHSLLSTELLRLNPDGTEAAEGNLSLSEAFFSPDELVLHGIDSVLQGAAANTAQELDQMIVDDVRNFLFGPPGAGGFDLASLNIQRGRDHGLPDYNQARIDLGLQPVSSFAEITSNVELQQKLEEVYGDVDSIDVWVGGLAEEHVEGSNVGELFQAILVDQFTRLRDGDRFWYQNQFEGEELKRIEETTLSDVISRNTDAINLQTNVFYDPSVLYVRVPYQDRSSNLLVRINENRIVVRDQRTGEVLQRVSTEGISKVILVGSDLNPDRFELDLRDTAQVEPMVIEVYGGVGGEDQLAVRGRITERFTGTSGSEIQVNQIEVNYKGIEQVSVRRQRTRRSRSGAESQTTSSQFEPVQVSQQSSDLQNSDENSDEKNSGSVEDGEQPKEEVTTKESSGIFELFDSVFQSISDDLLIQ